jgi:2-polyprenyl-6-methoxyphenol hydroxylase-like FAD-dependent oxidoreductase
MTPFAGVGVNAAMMDALELGRAIIGFKRAPDGQSFTEVIRSYDLEPFPRGERFAQKTMSNMKKHFSATGSEELAGRLRAAQGTLA